jgi:putative ABC transport system substrate-binding protein
MNATERDPDAQARLADFLQGLQEAGWNVGRNLRVDTRWTAGDAERTRTYAAELVKLPSDVIVTSGGTTTRAVQQATRTVPIVFVQATDPVGGGLVTSLARPGGNATGFSQSEYAISAKWMELLKQIAPRVTRAAVLRDAANPGASASWPRSNLLRRHWELSFFPSTSATATRSRTPSRRSRAKQTAG